MLLHFAGLFHIDAHIRDDIFIRRELDALHLKLGHIRLHRVDNILLRFALLRHFQRLTTQARVKGRIFLFNEFIQRHAVKHLVKALLRRRVRASQPRDVGDIPQHNADDKNRDGGEFIHFAFFIERRRHHSEHDAHQRGEHDMVPVHPLSLRY
ncbi:hypothetical protein BN130_3386 [Cronobacter malonaticus 507]|nr:hypothetical protein BN130_3386 [Cronobacter malonaticus 507]